jgi:hypothetical protein
MRVVGASNMCRLPGSGGTWMVVEGGMGSVTQQPGRPAERGRQAVLPCGSMQSAAYAITVPSQCNAQEA